MNNKHAKLFAQSLDRDAAEGRINFFAGFGHITKSLGAWGIGGIHNPRRFRNPTHKAFAKAHAGLVNRLGIQTFGGAKLERFSVAEQVNRTDFGPDRMGDQFGDLVEPLLACAVFGHRLAQAAQKLAALGFGSFSHTN